MSLVIPPGFGLAAYVLTGAVGTQPYVTTIGVDLSAAGGDFVGAANAAFDAYKEVIMPETTTLLTLDRVTLSVGQDGPGGSVDSTRTPVPGIVTGAFPPTSLSAILRKSTSELGRQGRGRMFIPGVLPESSVDQDGTVVAGERTSLTTAFSAFLSFLEVGAAVDPIPLPPVLLHSNPAVAPSPIIDATCSDLVGWIRGRIR